jgi:aminoglycoside phosphotransferase (APT) family kinase protein
MNLNIRNVKWMVGSSDLDSILENDSVTAVPMDPGLEAEVYRIVGSGSSYVLKVWNGSSRPHVELQYHLLHALYNRGIPVSHPFGWGYDPDMNPVLLTSYDGSPVQKVNRNLLQSLAHILMEIHRVPAAELESVKLPRYDFIPYFFPMIDGHQDLKALLEQFVNECEFEQSALIHGDYNLRNILIADGKFTIIDWTNGQLGDPRYDIAWAIVLVRIYVGERYGDRFQSSFLSTGEYASHEMELFEAIACLRWILLYRTTNIPRGKVTLDRVQHILRNNNFLGEDLIEK